MICQYKKKVQTSIAELPLFWAALAPKDLGPGADSMLRQNVIGTAPAPGKKKRLHVATAPDTKIFLLSFEKVNT